MAAGLFSHLCSDVVCESAGLYALDGQSASAHAVTAAAAMGANISEHKSRMLTPKIAESADIIVALGLHHAEALQLCYPHKRVLILGDGIDDPYGGSLADYKNCAIQIQEKLKELSEKL